MAELENWLAENYDAVVADENRPITYKSLAESEDKDLAAWARKRAADKGADTTPKRATSAPKEKRSEK